MEKFLSHSILEKISHVLEPFAAPNGKRQVFGRFHSTVYANELSMAAWWLDFTIVFFQLTPKLQIEWLCFHISQITYFIDFQILFAMKVDIM